jgi:hypothetical protein
MYQAIDTIMIGHVLRVAEGFAAMAASRQTLFSSLCTTVAACAIASRHTAPIPEINP